MARAGHLHMAHERLIPLSPPLSTLTPHGGLVRGSTVAATGSGAATSLALALCAESTKAGGWLGIVGADELGLSAAQDLGVHMERVVTVKLDTTRRGERTERRHAEVISALMDALDLILVGPSVRLTAPLTRRLTARARERGAVLIRLWPTTHPDVGRRPLESAWDPAPTLRLAVEGAEWSGIGDGHGYAVERTVLVTPLPRRQRQTVRLWLPDKDGQVRLVDGEALDHPQQRWRQKVG